MLSTSMLDSIHRGVYTGIMTRTQIYLPKSQLDALRTRAHKGGTTVSDVVRRIIDMELSLSKRENEIATPGESLLEAARRISKLGKPGPKDLSMNLDHYLYGTPKRYKNIR